MNIAAYELYALCAAVGFFFGLAAGLYRPLPPIHNADIMRGRPEDADLALPAPIWAADEMARLRRRAEDAEKSLELVRFQLDHFADAGKKVEDHFLDVTKKVGEKKEG